MFRRGKLSLLTTKDDRIKIVNERINLTEKYFMLLCSTFSENTRKLAKYRDSYDELAKGFKTYAEEEEVNDSLCEGLKSFTNATTILADFVDLKVHRMEAKVVNELAQFENLCKSTRDSLRIAVIARDKEVLKQRQMLELKSKFSANNSAADSELLKAKMEVNRTNKEIDEIINNFEKRKLTDIKTILTDFILISIKYHTKALEALSASYYDITNIDEKGDFVEFQKLMKTKEDPKLSKLSMKKKALRSQSLEHLDRDQLLSPLKRSGKITRSTKNLSSNEKDDSNEEDDDEDEENSDDNTSSDENDDDSDTEEEDDESDNAEEHKSETASESATHKLERKKLKPNTQLKKHPFKAITTTHAKLTAKQ